MSRTGIILNNIGSPESATPDDVGKYLKEFLMDKEILTLPFLIRYILVHFIIVPRRKYSSALKYKKVWGTKKSPLIEISEQFGERLQSHLGEKYFVELGMVNGKPSLQSALTSLKEKGVTNLFFAPLYPQYARATTFASIEKAKGMIKKVFGSNPALSFSVLKPFYNESSFIHLSAESLSKEWSTKKWQHILFSFHGLPESQIKKNPGCLATLECCSRVEACAMNCYRAQSVKTAQLIAAAAGLTKDQYTICFQSRLGPAKWIGPASIDVVKTLANRGIKDILVQTPSFVADCLETLEEISMELKEEFVIHGGRELKLVPCLNDDLAWVKGFAGLVQDQLKTEKVPTENI